MKTGVRNERGVALMVGGSTINAESVLQTRGRSESNSAHAVTWSIMAATATKLSLSEEFLTTYCTL